jgi:serine/threonine-protein kinase
VLCVEFGDEWWREVTLLFVGLPNHARLGEFFGKLLAGEGWVGHETLLRSCVEEASEFDAEPFVKRLEADPQGAGAQILLRLLRQRDEDEVRGRVEAHAGSATLHASDHVLKPPLTDDVCGIRFLWVPDGTFAMGADDLHDARPVHQVRISGFWLAETPVTNAQYRVFLDESGQMEPFYWRDRRFLGANQPVVGVSWDEAVAFCLWLSERMHRNVALPSEAQWEFAARGEDGRRFPWGNDDPNDSRACYGLTWDTGQPAPVGSYPEGQGPFGHLDLAGNVWEWCADGWNGKAYRKLAKHNALDPLVRPRHRSDRVFRGGAWDRGPDHLRSAVRGGLRAADRGVNLGFRVAVVPATSNGDS